MGHYSFSCMVLNKFRIYINLFVWAITALAVWSSTNFELWTPFQDSFSVFGSLCTALAVHRETQTLNFVVWKQDNLLSDFFELKV
uniref:Uncharacterized protein n=1 Tax=Rhizoctonia solani TaxID=456999 RepID=N0ABP3_9AGAM|nr:hypothetical protein RSOL_m00040 [Rhizoctonia solani]AGK45347.1 hypothetical protein RSOL_m00040 [Rhizoctonia solani]